MKDLVKTTKGTVHHYKDDSMEFIPHRSATSLTSTVCRWSVCETYELTNLLITLSLGFEANIYILYILIIYIIYKY